MLKSHTIPLFVCLLASAGAPALAQQQTLPNPLATSTNAVWLAHSYVATPASVALVPQTAKFLQQHNVTYWFVNVGRVDKTGKLPLGALAQAVNFLNSVHQWETENNCKFKVLAWINGSIDAANPDRFVDINQPELRAAIANEASKFTDVQAPESYVAGATRPFDGVQLDLEPSGGSDTVAANLFRLMDEIRQKIGPDKLTSFTPHKIGTRNMYWSTPEFYYGLGQRVDLICAMTYDTGLKDAAQYREWVKQQTTDVLRAISGATWNNDAAHPKPKNTVRAFIGLPAFPANQWHDVKVETVADGASGTHLALDELARATPNVLRYFGGTAIYLYTDGTGADDYSSPQNWAEFKSVWLQK
ncbi:hypothetical protein IAD21_05659 [Abditibacteriota bacterium]|nr:hypothetical protein IAD21_05659 [Abditibacteriota bacterium]